MAITEISLNLLRAFDAASRQGSFTEAAKELFVTQAAVSHQIKALEAWLGKSLFHRTSRGLLLTDEGQWLAPIVADALARIEEGVDLVRGGGPREVLTVGVVGTFAAGHLVRRLPDFRRRFPHIELRLLTNNNKPDPSTDSLDLSIRFGDGAWRSVEAVRVMDAPMTPLCIPAIADTLHQPCDLARWPLLRSYRAQDWPAWFAAAGAAAVAARGPQFDTSIIMIQAALLGEGVALAPATMFETELADGRLVQPFACEVDVGAYWLTRPLARPERSAERTFAEWLIAGA
ncbi:LysR family transcriptional regulator [Sphingopyxis sp. 113P3]|uniref:LysR family transcriptional regulator n=1 Tax=Sphingopyxis sp. (strain 113P3) TaxID=292913 RepID=UPI0006AD590A|nr:LysR family transcriptional regulator [Sphingopyxis sp. 113P3]ALC11729.1 LysR family transcriptional regulator [Sphingopyxis sp. 113P3]